jgi:hypothetical protein
MLIASTDSLVVGGILPGATLTDVRGRQGPCWRTFGGITTGGVVAALNGADARNVSPLGMLVGGSIVMPFVLRGVFGAADALPLAASGAWKGPMFLSWTVWWMSPTGAMVAVGARHRRRTNVPYVPAIAPGPGHDVRPRISLIAVLTPRARSGRDCWVAAVSSPPRPFRIEAHDRSLPPRRGSCMPVPMQRARRSQP